LLLDLLVKTTASLIRTLKVEDAVAKRMDNPLQGVFETRGPYGLTGLCAQRYEEFALEALALKVVLPPSADVPFIVPGEYSSGDVQAFLQLSRQYAGAVTY
jgi:hypothetical protein